MKIRILRDCHAPVPRFRYCCEICGHIPDGTEPTELFPGEEFDLDVEAEKIDLSGLTYRVDYDIIEYP